jgi:predicted porin
LSVTTTTFIRGDILNKRNIIAAAVLATTSGLCAAQSGVTIYGLVDVTLGHIKGAATGVNSQDQAVWRVDSGGMSTSHLGFRGTEDLGGGLSAFFDLSTFIRADTGASGRSDAIGAPANVAADPFWSRAAVLGVASRDYGRIRLGNVTTLLFFNSITSNAFGDSTVFGPLNLVTHIGGPQAGGTGWTNSVVYDSPVLGGASASLARNLSENQGGHNTAARVAYAQGPVAASIVWQSVKKNPATFADGTTQNNVDTWMLGGSYDFGAAKVYTHLGRLSNKGTETAPQNVAYRIVEVSASMPVGAGQFLAGYALRKTSDTPAPAPATAPGGSIKRGVLTVGYDHYLSKRTDLYAMVMSDKTETWTLPAPPRSVEASATSVGLGIRHRF